MLGMNIFRLPTHRLPFLFFFFLIAVSISIARSALFAAVSPADLTGRCQAVLTVFVLIAGILFSAARLPYLLEGRLQHLVGPVLYDDTWHFQEISSLVNSARYPAHFSLVPHAYFSLYYASWMLIAALYLGIPLAGFTVKAAFAVGCAIYMILIPLALLHVAISQAHTRRQIYWAIYLVGCWGGLESIFSLLYYVSRNAKWLVATQPAIYFPVFSAGIVWAPHHMTAAAALILCWYLWTHRRSQDWPAVLYCGLLVSFTFYASIFVFLGAIPLGLLMVMQDVRARREWLQPLAAAALSTVLIWPMLWLYLGKTSDVRFLFPMITNLQTLFPNMHLPVNSHSAVAMGVALLVFLVYLLLNFLPFTVALGACGKPLTDSQKAAVFLICLFFLSTFFWGFQEGDNYASRGFLVPMLVLGWICAGLMPSVPRRSGILVLLILGSFGPAHEMVEIYRKGYVVCRTPITRRHDRTILSINRDRSIRSVQPNLWPAEPQQLYEIQKFIDGGKQNLVTADHQLESPGPAGPWRWQRTPSDGER